MSKSEVNAFMKKLEHPFKAELEELRAIIIGVDDRIEESIKWKCPTFSYGGVMASLVVRTKKCAQVMFHKGVLLKKGSGLLWGEGKEVRNANFDDMASIKKSKKKLEALVKEWVVLKSK
jgi:hypothetical protein